MCGVGRGETPSVDVDGQMHGCVMFADSYQVFPAAFLRNRFEAMRMGTSAIRCCRRGWPPIRLRRALQASSMRGRRILVRRVP